MHVTKSAKLHGIMTKISPMKQNHSGKTKYFDENLSDGKRCVRFVCFDAKMHEKLSNVHEKKEVFALSNYEVKERKIFLLTRSCCPKVD